MTKYEILTITPFFEPDIGGIATHVLNLGKKLVEQGNNISIIAPKRISDKLETWNSNFKHVFRINSIYLPPFPYPTLKSVSIPIDFGLKIRSIIRNGNFDIVHVHGHHYPISWIAINSAHKYGIPSVLTLHGMYALNPNVLGGKSRTEDFFNRYVFSKILSKTNAVIGLTEEVTNYAKRFGKDSTKYFTIPNGVNVAIYADNLKRKIEYRRKYHINEFSTVVLFCGRFEQVKGIIEFSEAAKNIVKKDGVEVVIVGGGSLEPTIQSILKDVDGIHLLKWQPSEKIHELYIASDIFVIPSKFEALPLTIIEAMSAGLHILYTPVGGIPEILKRYSRKTTLAKVSADEIYDVLNDLIPNFSASDTLSFTYAQKFDWSNIAISTNQVYEECINAKTI